MNMKYDFDEMVDRRNTGSIKWGGSPDELPMWVADMDFKTAPEIIAALKKRVSHGVFGYSSPNEEWYEAYASYYQDVHQWKIDKGSLLFCLGVVPTISSSVRKLTEVGEYVVVMPPVYNIFYNSIINNGRIPLEVPLSFDGEHYDIDWAALEQAFAMEKTKLLIFCNPHNPVGRIWEKEELIRLACLAKRYGVIVLSDEIHGEITPLDKPYIPFLNSCFEAKEVGFAAISPTKCFNLAGIQTSAIVIDNEEIRKKVDRQINTDEVAEPNVFAIPAAIASYTKGRAWLEQMRGYVFENRAIAEDYIAKHIPTLKAIHGEATYLLWVNCRQLTFDDRALVAFIHSSVKLRLNDGSEYGKTGEGFFRMNLACPKDRLMEGLKRLKRAIDLYIKNQK